mmetsp:Transcript_28011/g.56734  ORF Transcript_28011/g.56734 Transcript_28011/m.56734 type:complete len:232 (+) Transcript_28011:159-854(+)
MSQEQSVVVSPAAHTKMILHACRNPHSQVHGVLIGSFDKQATGGPVLHLSDAIPIFHSSPTKPILDTALRLIEAHIDGSPGAVGIMGWYSANERLGDDARPGQAALRIVGGLATGFEDMGKSIPTHAELVTILVSNKDTVELLKDDGGNSGAAGLKVFGRDTRKHWLRPYAPGNVKCTSTSGRAAKAACLEDIKRMPIFDFEDHLDGGAEHLGERDWLTNTVVSGFVHRNE